MTKKEFIRMTGILKTGKSGKCDLRPGKTRTLFNLVLLVLILAGSTSGAENALFASTFFDRNRPAATAANFLRIGIGAKAGAMGGAFVGLADDPSAIYWNPAGLSQLDCPQVMFAHNRWAQDISYEYLSYALPINPNNIVAVALMFLHMGEILGYDENDKPTSYFSAWDAAMLLGYSRRISSHLSLGWTAKAIVEKLEYQKSQAAAFDMGLFYDTYILSFGLCSGNLGTKLKFVKKKHPLPAYVKAGFAVKALNNHLFLTTDLDFVTNAPPTFRQGIQYNLQDILYVRGGIEHKTQNRNWAGGTSPTVGGGIKVSKLKLDYTYSPVKTLGNLHTFSLIYRIASQ